MKDISSWIMGVCVGVLAFICIILYIENSTLNKRIELSKAYSNTLYELLNECENGKK